MTLLGEGSWQERILADATLRRVADAKVPVVDEIGLVPLKLCAGGPQDHWGLEELIAQADDGAVEGGALTLDVARSRSAPDRNNSAAVALLLVTVTFGAVSHLLIQRLFQRIELPARSTVIRFAEEY